MSFLFTFKLVGYKPSTFPLYLYTGITGLSFCDLEEEESINTFLIV